MAFLDINNLIIDNVVIQDRIDYKDKVLVIGDHDIIKKMFMVLSGINKGKGMVKSNNQDVFDNSDYFKERVLIDFSKRYITTLRKDTIIDAFKSKFQIDIDIEKFIRHINVFYIRKEAIFDVKYNFTPLGNTLLNYSMFDSINLENCFILNGTYQIEDFALKKGIIKGILDKAKTALVESNDLMVGEGFDYVLFVNKNKIDKINLKDEVLLINSDNIKDALYSFNGYTITKDNYTKEELKTLHKEKIVYKRLRLIDVISRMGDNHEKK